MLKNLWPFLLFVSSYAVEPVMIDCFNIEKVEYSGHDFYVLYIHDDHCQCGKAKNGP